MWKHNGLLLKMLRDHHVNFRSEASIADLAYGLRDAHDSREQPRFNVVKFVQQTLPAHLKTLRKGALKIEFYDVAFKQDDPAYVSFNPLILNVDRKVWADAEAGEDYPRFVIAHEIGHIVLHDYSAKAFSRDKADQIKFDDKEHSAEWQANTFAGHFLLPDPVIRKIDNVSLLASVCQVPEALALERLLVVRKEQQRKNRIFQGGFCSECGNFSLVRTNTLLKCTPIGCGNVISGL
jgi:Zn-dependent peptidase ImmA (M78 family)